MFYGGIEIKLKEDCEDEPLIIYEKKRAYSTFWANIERFVYLGFSATFSRFLKNNIFYLCLLFVFIGVICLIINSNQYASFPGLLLVSIFLILFPTIIIFSKYSCYLNKSESILLVFIPLIFLNYLYFIKEGSPVGFEDVHQHVFEFTKLFDQSGKLLFLNAQQLSFNFVGLYVIFKFLANICNVNVIFLASLVPPIFNLISIIFVYVIANRLHSHKIGLASMLFFGWENQVLIFGQEMRTQTLGTLLIFSLFAFILISTKNKRKFPSEVIVLIILLFGIVTTSFVSIFYTFILLLSTLITQYIISKIYRSSKTRSIISWEIFSLFIVFFIFYLLYIGVSFSDTLSCILKLIYEMGQENTSISSSVSSNTGQTIYGIFVQKFTYFFWGVFLLSTLFYTSFAYTLKKAPNLIFTGAFGSLFVFCLLNGVIGLLSPGRVYVISFIFISIVTSFGLLESAKYIKQPSIKSLSTFFFYVTMTLFIIASVSKIPNYVVGNTEPLRSEEPIDLITYWDSDLPQHSLVSFISSYMNDDQITKSSMLIRRYEFMQVSNSKEFKKSQMGNNYSKNFIEPTGFWILHDSFHGRHYTNRDSLPPSYLLQDFNKIYHSQDYAIAYRES